MIRSTPPARGAWPLQGHAHPAQRDGTARVAGAWLPPVSAGRGPAGSGRAPALPRRVSGGCRPDDRGRLVAFITAMLMLIAPIRRPGQTLPAPDTRRGSAGARGLNLLGHAPAETGASHAPGHARRCHHAARGVRGLCSRPGARAANTLWLPSGPAMAGVGRLKRK